MPFGKDLNEDELADGLAFDEEGQEEAKEEHAALVPLVKTMSKQDRMKKSMQRDGGADAFSIFNDSESDGEEEGEDLAAAPKFTPADAKEKTSLTSFIMQEAQMEATRDPGAMKIEAEMNQTGVMLQMLKDGVSLKTMVTKYLVPKSGLDAAFTGQMDLEERKRMVKGKTYTVEIRRVLYMLRDEKTIAWRGPVNEYEGFASPFCRTRQVVESYQLSHMYKPMVSRQKRFIRLTFKCPATAKVQYEPRKIDILAKDDDEYDLLETGFNLLWRYHSYKLKMFERDPKLLMRKTVARPTTLEEKWDLDGYSPLVFQSLDPDNNIVNVYIGLGRSKEDLMLIASFMIGFWALLSMLFGILMKASLDSDETNFALWAYFYFLMIFGFVCLLVVVLSKTSVEDIGLTSTTIMIDSKGKKTEIIKAPPPKKTCKTVLKGWGNTLGDWMMFSIFELGFGGPIALAWIVLWDNILHPMWAAKKNRVHVEMYKRFKVNSYYAGKSAAKTAKLAQKKANVFYRLLVACPAKAWKALRTMFADAKSRAKSQTLSKNAMRRKQTSTVGVSALQRKLAAESKNRGNEDFSKQLEIRKLRRQTKANEESQAMEKHSRGSSRSPGPPLGA